MRPKPLCLVGGCLAAGVLAAWVTTTPASARRQAAASPPPQGGGRGGGATVITIPPPRPPATGSGAISGVVTDGATRRPVAGAMVMLSGGPAGGLRPRQMTDDAGRFIFTDLPSPADYGLQAVHPDYLWGAYNAAVGENSARVALVEAQWFQQANLQLFKPASISGTVLDDRNEPVVGVPVRILKSVQIAGQARRAIGPVVETDDRGMYRVPDLQAGSYFVHVPSIQITLPDGAMRPAVWPQRPLAMARTAGGMGAILGHFPTAPGGASGRGYAMAYHPAARSADEALPIMVDFGESRTNADVQLTLVPTRRVSGTLSGTPDAIGAMPVWLVPVGDEASGAGGEAAITLSDSTGAFTFLNVPVGGYTLLASRSQSEYSVGSLGRGSPLPERGSAFNISMSGGYIGGAPGVAYATRGRGGVAAFGRVPVSVEDRDISNLVVPLTAGVRVSGHILWDGQPDPPVGATFRPFIGLESADGDLTLGFPQSAFMSLADQTLPSPVPFTIEGVLPGRYLVGTTLPGIGFALEGADWRGRDLLSTPLDIAGDADVTGVVVRLTAKTTTVSGTVRDANGAPATSGAVIAFPASPAAWDSIGVRARRFASTSIGAGGTYVHAELPPGDYLITAIAPADLARWLNREFLSAAAASAIRVRVDSGAATVQDLRMPGARR